MGAELERGSGYADVYNLTVEAGEYYAAGVLVHNCDQVQYACLADPLDFATKKKKPQLPQLTGRRWG